MAGLIGYLRSVPAWAVVALPVGVAALVLVWIAWGGGAAGLYVGIVGVVVAVIAAIDARRSSEKVARAAKEIDTTTRAVERADRLERLAGIEDVLTSITVADLFGQLGRKVSQLEHDLRRAYARAAGLDLPETGTLVEEFPFLTASTDLEGLRHSVALAEQECREARELPPR